MTASIPSLFGVPAYLVSAAILAAIFAAGKQGGLTKCKNSCRLMVSSFCSPMTSLHQLSKDIHMQFLKLYHGI